MYDLFFLSIVVDNIIKDVFDFFPRYVCRFCYCTCPFSTAYSFDIKMINCYKAYLLVWNSFSSFLSFVFWKSITTPFISTYKNSRFFKSNWLSLMKVCKIAQNGRSWQCRNIPFIYKENKRLFFRVFQKSFLKFVKLHKRLAKFLMDFIQFIRPHFTAAVHFNLFDR